MLTRCKVAAILTIMNHRSVVDEVDWELSGVVMAKSDETRDWIVGEAPTIADLSCCGYLYYPEPYGFDRKDWPNVDAWLDRIAGLPGWKHPYDLMQRAFPAT